MTQIAALFLDAYRELNARKLFWITMILSGVVVAAFALVGINEQGLHIIVWDVPFGLTTAIMAEDTFYKSMFVSLGIGFWLTWIAAVLALVSTASIFPDFLSGGAIDMVLSKPIGRLRLFFTKYLTGLLFVALQVTVFCAASFLVIGLRGGAWEPGLFLAVPVVVLFFSYLYCVCVLAGLLTRSTIAALILTLLFWLLIFGVHVTESTLLFVKFTQEQQVEATESSIKHDQSIVEAMRAGEDSTPEAIAAFEHGIEDKQEELEGMQRIVDRLDVAHSITMAVKTALPKTTETVTLLERWLIDAADLGEVSDTPSNHLSATDQAAEKVADVIYERTIAWIVGTSVLFEFVILVLASWIFMRRDF